MRTNSRTEEETVETTTVTPPTPTSMTRESVTTEVTDFVNQCTKVSILCSWLPNKRTVTKATKEKLADMVGGSKRRFSGTKTLFNPKTPVIEAYNVAKAGMETVRRKWLINLGRHVQGTDTVEADNNSTYVLRVEDINAFERDFQEAKAAIELAREAIRSELPSIREDARRHLGSEYDDAHYANSMIDSIQVGNPVYSDFQVDVRVPAHIQQRQLQSLHSQAAATIQNGVSRMVDEFAEHFARAMNQFRRRKEINPARGHELHAWRGAEIVVEMYHQHDPDNIPPNHIKIDLRKKTGDQSTTQSFIVSRDDYETSLRVTETEQDRPMRGDIIGDIRTRLEEFSRLQGIFGTAGVSLSGALGRIREVLGSLPADADQVRDHLRASADAGRSIAQTMRETLDDLRVVETSTRKRLRVLIDE
jgi:hypothetical protein